MKFNIEQIALCPPDPAEAIKLLKEMGADEWVQDLVVATGTVGTTLEQTNVATLAFNYTALDSARELEVLHYCAGSNWMEGRASRVSHIGMHVDAAELQRWRTFFKNRGYDVAQEVHTDSHTNPAIAGKRWYHYVIFDTYRTLGVDVKFIVRREPGE